jgi:hypothetical protein
MREASNVTIFIIAFLFGSLPDPTDCDRYFSHAHGFISDYSDCDVVAGCTTVRVVDAYQQTDKS